MSVNIRQFILKVHCYSGLLIALFLVITGVTGSLLAFHEEIDNGFNQDLVSIHSLASKPDSLKEKSTLIASAHDVVIHQYPNYRFSSMPTEIKPNKTLIFSVDYARTEEERQLPQAPFDTVYVNPYDRHIVGVRDKKAWAWRNVMPKVFELHWSLLVGRTGIFILGIVALIWTINCFIGFYLTLPRPVRKKAVSQSKQSAIKRYFKKWRPAWRIRRPNFAKLNLFKLSFDIHNAFGLWLWLMLFVLAWSSVKFNLNSVYDSVMEGVVGLKPWSAQIITKDPSESNTATGITQHRDKPADQKIGTAYLSSEQSNAYQVTKANSVAVLRQLAQTEAIKAGAQIEQNLAMRWDKDKQQWQMRFTTNKDIGKYSGASSIAVDALTGEMAQVNLGFQTDNAHKIDYWLASLHMGHIGLGEEENIQHRLFQVFLIFMGLVVVVLSVTGVYLWWRKRPK